MKIPEIQNNNTGAGFRVMLYSHDTMGLGHLKRNLKIINTLKSYYPELTILLATGSTQIYRYQLPTGINCINLPPVYKIGKDMYESGLTGMSFDKILRLRTMILLETVKSFSPHILIVDHSPLGMKGEIIPSLEWLNKPDNKSLIILGMRDIIDEPEYVIDYWNQKDIYNVLTNLYDHIFIYGDKQVYDPVTMYKFPDDVKGKTSYCGYITEPSVNKKLSKTSKSSNRDKEKFVLITIGGGEWLADVILQNYLEMLSENQSKINYNSIILTGPFIPEILWSRLRKISRGLPVKMRKFIPQIQRLLSNSHLVISSAGYNTITDIMSFANKALVIPRIKFRKEQQIRAERLNKLGLIDMLYPDDVNPKSLFDYIERSLSSNSAPLAEAREQKIIDLDGNKRLAEYIGKFFSSINENRETAVC